jgi:hypothetical protein
VAPTRLAMPDLLPARISVEQTADLRQNACMATRWRAPGGWTVEVVRLSGTPDHHDGEWLRLCQYGAWAADVRSPAELEQWFALADLEPDGLSARSRWSMSVRVFRGWPDWHLWPEIGMCSTRMRRRTNCSLWRER